MLARVAGFALIALVLAGCQVPVEKKEQRVESPEDRDAVARASKLWSAGKLDQARAELEAALAEDPSNTRARYLYANLLVEKGELRAAGVQLDAVTKKSADDRLAWNRLGEVREALGEQRAALEAYQRTAELSSTSPDPYRSIARVQLILGDGESALAACDAARARSDKDPLAESIAVRAHLLLGQEDRAVLCARRFIEWSKDVAELAARSDELKAFIRARSARLGQGDMATCVDYVRTAFRPRLPSADPPENAVLAHASPVLSQWDDRAVFVTLIAPDGGARWRGRGRGRSLGSALAGAVEALREDKGFDPAIARTAAVRIDVQRGDFERVSLKPAKAGALDDGASIPMGLASDPPIELGVHGVAARIDGRETFCLPGDAVTEDLADVDAMLTFACSRAGIGARSWESAASAIVRFRTDSFVSPEPGAAPVVLERGEPLPFADPTAETLVEAAVSGAEYLARSVRADDGRFIYLYDAHRDREIEQDYNDVRHAGAALAMVEVAARAKRLDLRDVAQLPARWLERQVRREGDRAFVVVDNKAKLGTQALTLLLLDELTATAPAREKEDPGRTELREALARGVASMMRDDGTFETLATITGLAPPAQEPSQFFPGEACLALARHAKLGGGARWRDLAARAIDARIGEWRARAGTPFLDPWLARAILELDAIAPSAERTAAALEIAKAIVAHQRPATDGDAAFGLAEPGELFPRGMPTASLGEGLAAAALVGKSRELRDAARGAAGFVLRHQYGRQHAFYLASVPHARGGVRSTLTRARVRIDGVQHAVSFWLLVEKLLRE